jgi:hypothetical protein
MINLEESAMSRTTEILISTSQFQHDPRQSIQALLRLTGAEEASIASRTVGESREFEAYSAFISGESEDSQEESVLIGYDIPADKIQSLYRDGTCLILDLSNCPLCESIGNAIQASIPTEDLDEFFLNSVILEIGEHDVFDVNYSDEVTYFGRFSVTLKFEARGTPASPDDVRDQILALEEFQEVLARFEKEIGPAQVIFRYWV